MNPAVSVVLPAFNGAQTLERTLRSLAAQDYRPLELLVVDDGSAEPVTPLVDSVLSGSSLSAVIIRHPTNEGLSRTLNDGWRRATGDAVLIIHQDIELLGTDWLRRAVAILRERDDVQVVTCDYGLADQAELDFAARAFGFLRRQFHTSPVQGRELVTFTEFKCDLVRKAALESLGGFPANYRIAGEDILLSFRIRQRGGAILKAYDLQAIQRFAGTAATVRGNLWKEYRFGMAFAGVFLAFRGYGFRGLGGSAYSRSRSWHRALQPPVTLAELALISLSLVPGWTWVLGLLVLLLAVRYAGYAARLWPDFRRFVHGPGRALLETLGASALGLVSDLAYSAGFAVGLVRALRGAPL